MAHLSRHMAGIEPSDIRKWTSIIEQKGGINLAQGNCFIEPSPHFDALVEATLRAMEAGKAMTGYNTYCHTSGVKPLREAIAKKCREFNHFSPRPDLDATSGNITVTAGATGGLDCTLHAIMDPGDEIILLEPFYNYHLKAILMQSGVPRFARLAAPGWSIDIEEVAHLINNKTRAVIINTPNNPTGKVFTRQELEALGRLCIRNNIYLVSDEVYEFITFDSNVHVSAASIDEIAACVITISAFSKTLAITGWRVGYVVAPQDVSQRVRVANEMNYVCAPTPLQHGVAALVDQWQIFLELRHHFAQKRLLLCSALSATGLTPSVPSGAYYVLSDCSGLDLTDDVAINLYLIDKYSIAGVPGSAFFSRQPRTQLMRFCFAITDKELSSLTTIMAA